MSGSVSYFKLHFPPTFKLTDVFIVLIELDKPVKSGSGDLSLSIRKSAKDRLCIPI